MNRKKMTWLIHVLAWVIMLGFPLLSVHNWSGDNGDRSLFIARTLIISLMFILVFYINYVRFIDKYLFAKDISKFLLFNLLIIALCSGVIQLCMNKLIPINAPQPPIEEKLLVHFLRDVFFMALASGLAVAIKVTVNWYKVDEERKELERINTQTELKNLKSQLNPHFLFNTLNNIYSLVSIQPTQAQEAIHQLSKLLRYVLYEDNQAQVPLAKDIEFINSYVDLMRIRLPENAQLEMDVNSAKEANIPIAPLLFISLIENAFKHGISNSKPSFVHIKIAYHEDSKLVDCQIVNSYYPKKANDQNDSGIGLINLKKRLDLLYPNRHTLNCQKTGDNYTASLQIDMSISEMKSLNEPCS